ncbi:hypothetical protein G7Z17_g5094 [Cylindrodendrum hubeiense]|uniref:Uncharacterized protein n=1 Tax=Cylindrodendrum hubeiense TaxID=595255 RepID=A0A9P5L9C9_9HYPO|nr:hypothetical protein G7Z17_g5094 [Cylindrodendrum hubeiense]
MRCIKKENPVRHAALRSALGNPGDGVVVDGLRAPSSLAGLGAVLRERSACGIGAPSSDIAPPGYLFGRFVGALHARPPCGIVASSLPGLHPPVASAAGLAAELSSRPLSRLATQLRAAQQVGQSEADLRVSSCQTHRRFRAPYLVISDDPTVSKPLAPSSILSQGGDHNQATASYPRLNWRQRLGGLGEFPRGNHIRPKGVCRRTCP